MYSSYDDYDEDYYDELEDDMRALEEWELENASFEQQRETPSGRK